MIRPDAAASPPPEGPSRLRGADAFRLHLTLTLGLMVCAGAFSIEVWRALGGNKLSWLYVFEWPLFAGFGIYMWWNLLTGRDRIRPSSAGDVATPLADGATDHAKKLEAWNRYLGQMSQAEAQETSQAEAQDEDRVN